MQTAVLSSKIQAKYPIFFLSARLHSFGTTFQPSLHSFQALYRKTIVKQVKMPYSPATPSKSAKDSPLGSSRVALQSAEKPTSTSKAKQSAVLEPSPASTYGDTAAGDSSPATPFESGKHGKSSTLQHPSVYLSTSLPLTLLPPTDLALLPCPSCFSIFFPFYLSIPSSLHLSTSPRMHLSTSPSHHRIASSAFTSSSLHTLVHYLFPGSSSDLRPFIHFYRALSAS